MLIYRHLTEEVSTVMSLVIIILASLLSGCTFIGVDHPSLRRSMDFGPPEVVNFCVYLDSGISRDEATGLLDEWNQNEADKYRLYVRPVSFSELSRDGYLHGTILDQVYKRPLEPECDRAIYFVGRGIGDFAWGLTALVFPLPEVLGEADDPTLTHGFVVARRATPVQLLVTPDRVTVHELYHLLGCRQHFDMPACYREIAALKAKEAELKAEHYFRKIGEPPFYPTWHNLTDEMLTSRAQVNRAIAESQ